MIYDPQKHHRHSIRLKGYDYSQSGLYFITLCCKDREYLFGNINEGTMYLNDAGTMILKWYNELEHKFHDIKCLDMVVMPNHFHCIIENIGSNDEYDIAVHSNNIPSEHEGSPLHRVVQWFKTMTTNEYIRGVKNQEWQAFNGTLWQRNYFEHIIRNEQIHLKIAEYIASNPSLWDTDSLK